MSSLLIIQEAFIEVSFTLLLLFVFYILALLCDEKEEGQGFHSESFQEMKEKTWKWGNK